ncbi:hypothetical protein LIER_21826 [Lithospermum erythrorhizon]|uniref:Reverse transcriptase Ty1/copia-type domain-containing protein n=1 Tax=Lithospermum erythrorhizon TaxID=34254 RepID=A0AAV3QUK8_LITER
MCALKFDVPNCVWSCKDVSYDHLRVFEYMAYVHTLKDERSKLDEKSKKRVFVGYGLDEFGYRFFDPVQRKFIRSCDIVFMEDYTIEDIDKVEKEDPTFEDEEMVDTGSTTIANTPVIFNDAPIENQVQDLKVNNALNPNDFIDVETKETNVETEVHHEVESVEQPIVSNELKRSICHRTHSVRYSSNEYIFLTDGGEPERFEENLKDENKKEWMDTMEDEMQSLRESNTFELVKLPKGKKVLKNQWVYRIKQDEMVLGLSSTLYLEVEQIDMKTAFLHVDVHEEIYMEQQDGFREKGKEDYVCKLVKSLMV